MGENIILYLVEYAYETHLPKKYVQHERLNNNNNIKYTEHKIFKKMWMQDIRDVVAYISRVLRSTS